MSSLKLNGKYTSETEKENCGISLSPRVGQPVQNVFITDVMHGDWVPNRLVLPCIIRLFSATFDIFTPCQENPSSGVTL